MLGFSVRYIHHRSSCPETIARERRVELFKSATGLEECEFRSRNYRPIVVSMIPRGWRDHVTLWSTEECLFSLSEPYLSDPPPTNHLPYIEVPTPLAPYCGSYFEKENALPRTRSWLFCESKNSPALRQIKKMLENVAAIAPPWNEY